MNGYKNAHFNRFFGYGVAVFCAAFIAVLAGCSSPNESGLTTNTPVASDYEISGLGPHIFNGTSKPVTITRKDGKLGGSITVYYNGSMTEPFAVGSYRVTFDVAEAFGWNPARGLDAGTLTISEPTDITAISADTWVDGNITADGGQWFKFTATEVTQYIHFDPGTLNFVEVQLYDSTGATGVKKAYLSGYNLYTSLTLTPGKEYYIHVPNYNFGAYKIGFNGSTIPPVIALPTTGIIQLSADTWADGDIAASNEEQWFRFTAVAAAQYIHFDAGDLDYVSVQMYNSSGAMVVEQTNLTSGGEYYIRVKSYNGGGEYKILFSARPMLPDTIITPLVADTWGNGNIAASGKEQWFKFTATADNQYIHFDLGTLSDVYIQLYDTGGATVGVPANLYSTGTLYTSRMLTSGTEYFIRVTSYSGGGAYKIGFSVLPMPPETNVTTLGANTWAAGNITGSGKEQWFKFTATADNQYIHFEPGTLSSVYIQLYDSAGETAGNQTNLSGSTSYASRTLTSGNEYYIKVMIYSNSGGAYRIGFSGLPIPPDTTITPLGAETWADGNIAASNGVQWFRFTATASAQYIHFEPGALSGVSIQLYDTAGTAVSYTRWEDSINSWRTTLTAGNEYYIKVTGYSGSGAYRIVFSAFFLPPDTNVTTLSADTWANGNIGLSTATSVQWFKFTATASTQYIHFDAISLRSLYIQLYDTDGTAVDYRTNLSESALYASRTLTPGNEYYIRVTPSNFGGRYMIGFTASTVQPSKTILPTTNVTTLNANTWADGGISEWFKFTATAAVQYIHFSPGNLTGVYVRLYDSNGGSVGGQTNLSGSTSYIFRTLTSGSDYYIRVMNAGAYKIGFTSMFIPPGITVITTLSDNIWTYGNITSDIREQWFKFTATADDQYQYIHFERGTLSSVYIQLYDSAGVTVVDQTQLSDVLSSVSRMLTIGSEYYIKVTPTSNDSRGGYRIGFNVSLIPLFTNGTALIADTWTLGSISANGAHWYKFTVTAATQYIYFDPIDFNFLYLELYDSTGAKVSNETFLQAPVWVRQDYFGLPIGSEFYIRVRTGGTYGGGYYRIGFSASSPWPN